MDMFASKSYRVFLGKLAITPLMVLLLASCGSSDEKPDLGPRRAPRDNAAASRPTPPPKVDALVPGYDIPKPRYGAPVMVDEVPAKENFARPPAPNQSGMVTAPKGTVSMGGYPQSAPPVPLPVPTLAPAPAPTLAPKQAVTSSVDSKRLPTAQFLEGVPELPSVPKTTMTEPLPPVSHSAISIDPVTNTLPEKEATPEDDGSFWNKVTGFFGKKKEEPQPVSPGQEGGIEQPEAAPLDENSAVEPQADPITLEPSPKAAGKEEKAGEPSAKLENIEEQTGTVIVPDQEPVQKSSAEKKKSGSGKDESAFREEKGNLKKVVIAKPQPDAAMQAANSGKSISELIEERRQQYGLGTPVSPRYTEPQVEAASLQQPAKYERLDNAPASGADAPLDTKAAAAALDEEILLEFNVDQNGNLVGLSPGLTHN